MKLSQKAKCGLSMDALKTAYQGKIEALGKGRVDFCEFYELMQECIGKFHGLAHLTIYSPFTYRERAASEKAFKQANTFGDLTQRNFQLYDDPLVKKRYQYLIEKYRVDTKLSCLVYFGTTINETFWLYTGFDLKIVNVAI